MTKKVAQTERTRLRRLPKRGHFERETINAILDEAFICHVGFVVDGQPYVIPTGFGRVDNDLYIHGSSASRMLREISKGVDVCVTVTLIDGLVIARSAFHHSVNYRSVVVLGRAELVTDADEKNKALEAITDHFVPGRWADCRLPNEIELKATSVLRLAINEASAKIRTGDPVDDDEDYSLGFWAGVLPMKLISDKPQNDAKLAHGIDPPDYITSYNRNGRK